MTTVTQWFNSDDKPVHIGVYSTRFDGMDGWSYWNGRRWTNQQWHLEGFDKPKHKKWFGGAAQHKAWRGLAVKPKSGISSK